MPRHDFIYTSTLLKKMPTKVAYLGPKGTYAETAALSLAKLEKLAETERARGRLYERIADFFKVYDFLVTPATVVPPFDVNIHAVDEVAGHKFENYFDWYTIAYAITVTSLPALSLPCGFTEGGLPIGLQVVGPPHGEAALLEASTLFEEIISIVGQLPIDPRPSGFN